MNWGRDHLEGDKLVLAALGDLVPRIRHLSDTL
jgi:hypothetical protein